MKNEPEDFRFQNGDWVLTEDGLGEIIGTAFFSSMPDAYQVKFDKSSRWYFDESLATPTHH